MNWIEYIPTILLALVALLLLVAVLQKSPEFPAQIHIVQNKQQRLNEPDSYYHIRAKIEDRNQVKNLLFTRAELDKAIYRAARNPEDVH